MPDNQENQKKLELPRRKTYDGAPDPTHRIPTPPPPPSSDPPKK